MIIYIDSGVSKIPCFFSFINSFSSEMYHYSQSIVNYSITGKGLDIIKNLQLIVDKTGCYVAKKDHPRGLRHRLDHRDIPYELRENRRSGGRLSK